MRKPVELQSLRAPFVVLAALIALSTGWAVYDEIFPRRPWKEYQRQFFKLEEKRLLAEKAEAQAAVNAEELAAAKKELDEATAAISDPAKSKAYKDAQKALREAKLEAFDAKQELGFAKARVDEEYYFLREARHRGTQAEIEHHTKKMAALQAQVEKRQKILDAAQAKEKEAEKGVKAFEERKAAAQAKVQKLQAPIEEIDRKLAKVVGKWPMLEQYWIPEMGVVDRCQNCHAGIDKSGYSRPYEIVAARAAGMDDDTLKKRFAVSPATAEKYATVHGALCPSEGEAAPDPAAATACVEGEAAKKLRETFKNYCGSVEAVHAKYVQKDQELCTAPETASAVAEALKQADYDVPLVFQTHPYRWDLLVTNHPPEKFGCTTCHGGQGPQTKGVGHQPFAHGNDDHYWPIWQDPLLDRVRVVGEDVVGAFNQSTCFKCHKEEQSLAHAPLLNQGKQLVVEMGCTGCHPIEGLTDARKRGPQLLTITAKATPGWLLNWIEYPKAWRPRTQMPNFWPGAVDPETRKPIEGSEALAKREKEATAIAAYLIAASNDALPIQNPPPMGDAAKGKELAESVGCRACHAFTEGDTSRPSRPSKDRDYAPNLWNVGDKINYKWAYNWLKDPKAVWPGTKMPSLRLSDDEARHLAAYLVSLKSGASFPEPPALAERSGPKWDALVADGKKLIQFYGCFGCHDIKGFETAQKIGAELTEFGKKTPDLLDFGDYITNPKEQTWYNWTHEKLRRPRIYAYERSEAKMPQFDFTEREILALMVFLKSQNGAKVPTAYLASRAEGKAAWHQAEKLVEAYGCRNCHIVKGEGGTVRDLYEEQPALAPPPLPHGPAGQGLKVQPTWLFHFLKDPGSVTIRPWLSIRMPTFQFTDEEATTLVKGFAGDARASFPFLTVAPKPLSPAEAKEAKELFDTLQCLRCHVIGKPPPDRDLSELAPDFALAKTRLRPEWFEPWLKNPEAIQPGTRMPGFFPEFPTSYYPQFGGDGKKQVEALMRYIYNLPSAPAKGVKTAAAQGPKTAMAQ